MLLELAWQLYMESWSEYNKPTAAGYRLAAPAALVEVVVLPVVVAAVVAVGVVAVN